jgi:CubicO group peptidase (beta-lactamase class C family)
MAVRHLLNQTSALPTLPGWIQLGDFDASPEATERQARALSTLKLTRPVGSEFEYTNLNYNLLGLIVEAAGRESYADYVQNHIFTPLRMGHSYTAQGEARPNGLAVGYQYWFAFPFAAPNLPMPRGSLPSGQLISSSEDMAHYLIAQLNEGRYGDVQILSGAGIQELHRGVAEQTTMGISAGKYGMGWYSTDIGQIKTIWHTGTLPDFTTYMAIVPDQKKGVVLLVNSGHFMMEPVMSELGSGLVPLLAGQQPAPNPYGFMLWGMRALLLIPLLQIVGVALTLRALRRWNRYPDRRPSQGRIWGLYILLPLIPNLLLAAVPIYLLVTRMLGFMLLLMPDVSWTALICGGFAGIWSILRTVLLLRTLQEHASPRTFVGRLNKRRGVLSHG